MKIMKKSQLKPLQFAATETLTRGQMKNVTGGGALACGGPGHLCITHADCCPGLPCVYTDPNATKGLCVKFS